MGFEPRERLLILFAALPVLLGLVVPFVAWSGGEASVPGGLDGDSKVAWTHRLDGVQAEGTDRPWDDDAIARRDGAGLAGASRAIVWAGLIAIVVAAGSALVPTARWPGKGHKPAVALVVAGLLLLAGTALATFGHYRFAHDFGGTGTTFVPGLGVLLATVAAIEAMGAGVFTLVHARAAHPTVP